MDVSMFGLREKLRRGFVVGILTVALVWTGVASSVAQQAPLQFIRDAEV
jgi:hypothetical protein